MIQTKPRTANKRCTTFEYWTTHPLGPLPGAVAINAKLVTAFGMRPSV